ncbi:MAG: hypothetical protein JWR69_3047 [Pedosphaera sp.]|nr:hypothetical protein [Pedosphaera sp.]
MTDIPKTIDRANAWHRLKQGAEGEVERNKILLGLELLKLEGEIGKSNFKTWASINLPDIEWPLVVECLRLARAHEEVRGKQIAEIQL